MTRPRAINRDSRGSRVCAVLTLMVAIALGATSGCRQALGDRCDERLTCEHDLICRDGRCVPAPEPSPLDQVAVAQSIELGDLVGEVDVVIDRWATPHVYATTTFDAWAAVGYVMCRDRGVQLELARREATGRLAEVAHQRPGAVEGDLWIRLLGLPEVAEASWAETPASAADGQALLGFSAGVNAFLEALRQGDESLPEQERALLEAADDWSPVDSIAIALLDELRWTWRADQELELHLVLERANSEFTVDALDADLARRSGFAEDILRLDPIVTTATPHRQVEQSVSPGPTTTIPLLSLSGAARLEGWRRALELLRERLGPAPGAELGWVAGADLTTSGGGLLVATRTGPLRAPVDTYALHMEIDEASEHATVAGLCTVGVPAVDIGFNEHIAWARLPSRADLVDLYLEEMGEIDGEPAVVSDGVLVPVERFAIDLDTGEETLRLEGGRVPHHGPLLPSFREGTLEPGWGELDGLSVRWMGQRPRRQLVGAHSMTDQESTAAALTTLQHLEDPSARWLVTDLNGSVGSLLPICLPRRPERVLPVVPARTAVTSPMVVMPGWDGAEWAACNRESIDEESLSLDPAEEMIIAAGAEPTGASFDNSPFRGGQRYLGWAFEPGLRTALLEGELGRLTDGRRASALEQAEVLVDDGSLIQQLLTPALAAAIARGRLEIEESSTQLDLTRLINRLGSRFSRLEAALERLRDWDGTFPATGDSESAAAAAIVGAWLPRLFELVLGDELDHLEARLDRATAWRALARLLRGEVLLRTSSAGGSSIFDDLRTESRYESQDERLLRSLDAAIRALEEEQGEQMDQWSWADWRQIELRSGGVGDLPEESFEPTDQTIPGGPWSPLGCEPSLLERLGRCRDDLAVARFVVEMRPWGPEGMMIQAGGQRGRSEDPRSQEAFELWLGGGYRPLVFNTEEVAANAATRVRLSPPGSAAHP